MNYTHGAVTLSSHLLFSPVRILISSRSLIVRAAPARGCVLQPQTFSRRLTKAASMLLGKMTAKAVVNCPPVVIPHQVVSMSETC